MQKQAKNTIACEPPADVFPVVGPPPIPPPPPPEGEKRQPEIRLRFVGYEYRGDYVAQI